MGNYVLAIDQGTTSSRAILFNRDQEIVAVGQPALQKIAKVFGSDILDDSGKLRRDRMRTLVFDNPEERKKLESILHPLIFDEMMQRINTSDSPYCIVSSPLLLESQSELPLNRVLVIDTSLELQLERASIRDNTDPAEIEKIASTQMQRNERLDLADDVITNNGDLGDLKKQVSQLHQNYLQLADNNGNPHVVS